MSRKSGTFVELPERRRKEKKDWTHEGESTEHGLEGLWKGESLCYSSGGKDKGVDMASINEKKKLAY